ncbi:MAG: peptide chain release factor 2 [Candidatus Berkelbacteria bacterium Licking1014_7]|uniref:Peptide chain release factor 2 n=1 Tax=Candidatus Berkelbacteria bacterium Licking1014_7 TaxID=2017147 RepID=A0A554LHT2_9BACT|nr:MAG: peptide chain release factor 2 [Candidatus Berkelbacteria bacterium Licking1014_7]
MDLTQKKQQLAKILKIDELKIEARDLEKKMQTSDFWKDYQKSQKVNERFSQTKKVLDDFENAQTEEQIKNLEILALLSGQYDKNNAILTISAGAGGTEAQDWANMLFRMIERYAQNKNYKFETIDKSLGQEAGIKSATVKISGLFAYGYLKAEAGVHRLVRLSPFDADKARHTSFALVEVIPEIEPRQFESISDKDLRVDVFHASGHGGQSVNTTDSAVRITHIPTGLTVSCQNERSQTQNKLQAMSILLSRLNALKLKEHKEKIEDLRGVMQSPEWGSQIRSYVLHPYKLVKDHRTGFESTDPEKVLDGDLQDFIEEYLKRHKSQNIKKI